MEFLAQAMDLPSLEICAESTGLSIINVFTELNPSRVSHVQGLLGVITVVSSIPQVSDSEGDSVASSAASITRGLRIFLTNSENVLGAFHLPRNPTHVLETSSNIHVMMRSPGGPVPEVVW